MSISLRMFALLGLLVLGGCVPFWREWMRPAPSVPPVPVGGAHESWCYNTLGAIDCYPTPQRLPPESLVSVEPPSRFPLTREAHAKAVAEAEKAAR